jgi:hypothetical protein
MEKGEDRFLKFFSFPWGAILLYITPTKHVKLELLSAAAQSNLPNIEKVIANAQLNGKAIYLPPKYLKDPESSLIFVPSNADQPLPRPEEVDEENLYSENPRGMFLTPPGLALSRMFEKELGTSFMRLKLYSLQTYHLPRLFIKKLKIAEDMRPLDVEAENNMVNHGNNKSRLQ